MVDRFTSQVLTVTADHLAEQPAGTINGTDVVMTMLAASDVVAGERVKACSLWPACEALPLLCDAPDRAAYIALLRAAADKLLVVA